MLTNSLIYIVDDDEMWTVKLQQILSDLGYTKTKWFSNGADCVAAIDKKPAVVFLDFKMEEADGLEVLQNIKAVSPETEVVFCTGNEDISVAIKAIEFGSVEYLLKSNASQKELKRIISTLNVA